MEKSSSHKLKVAKRILFSIVGVLLILTLIFSAFSKSVITKSRSDGSYEVLKDVTLTKIESGSKIQNEFRFTLENIQHAEVLSFFINHHYVDVYIEDECVYTLSTENKQFATTGGTWVMIPLYYSDEGKEVKVVLTPIYDNYITDDPDFLLGSEIAIHNATLHMSLPTIVLAVCVIFSGFLLICLVAYHSFKSIPIGRLYALGLMAISTGLWRITYDKVSYLLLENHSLLLYTVSILSLMCMALSMLNVLERNEKSTKFIRIFSCAFCVLYSIQLLLQITGVLDLRQTLRGVHLTLIISAASFIADGIVQLIRRIKNKDEKFSYTWLLGVGVVVDLIIYYVESHSFNIVCTLIAILCYTILEGINLMYAYIEQRNTLEEMKTQLALSRTTTMMSQIRSHFVFNILNAISGMCKYDPELADDTVIRFARYLRNNIDIMEDDKNIPFATDLRQLEDYVALEQVRFGDKIEFYSDIETDNFMIPPLILQPVVENAIKHGISKKEGNGTIILRTRDVGENIIITIKDDGVGFDMEELNKEKSVGIRNICFRLEHLVHGKMDIESEINVGTTVTITIPKEKQ